MAKQNVISERMEGKELESFRGNIEQAKWECETAIARLIFLAKMLKPEDENDESGLSLTDFERKGLAAILEDVQEHLHSIWSQALAPVSEYMGTPKEVRHG